MNDLIKTLKKVGLNEKEAALYIAALNLGEAPMSRLAKEAELKRTTAYQIFRALEKRGIMGSFKMRSGLKFTATRPDSLFALCKEELEDFAAILPELKAFEQKRGARPKLSYYEGQEGYRLALEDSLQKPHDLLRHIGSITESHKILDEKYDLDHYLPTRIRRQIRIKCLYFLDIERSLMEREHAKELREIRYLPQAHWFEGSTLIYDDKVVILSGVEEMMTVVIESKTVAEAEKQKFDLLWDSVDPVSLRLRPK